MDAIEWACALWASAFKMTERVKQWVCIKFCVNLEHISAELFRWFRKLQLWVTGDWQPHHNNMPAHASHLMQSFWWNIKSPRWLSPLQPRLGAVWLQAFPKTKITFEREEISDCLWDSGKYDRPADGNSNKGFYRLFWMVEEMLGKLCKVPGCLLWKGLRHHYRMHKVSCILNILQ